MWIYQVCAVEENSKLKARLKLQHRMNSSFMDRLAKQDKRRQFVLVLVYCNREKKKSNGYLCACKCEIK